MRLLSPRLTVLYEMAFLVAVSVACAHFFNIHHPEGLTWERAPLRQSMLPAAAETLPGASAAQGIDTPEALQAFTEGGALFIDARFVEDFEEGHVPGAVNIPPGMFAEDAQRLIGAPDAGRRIIIYCSSITCHMSAELAESLDMLGYGNLFVYGEGFAGWLAAGGAVEVGSGDVPADSDDATGAAPESEAAGEGTR
ncbi:rhodanese-related sulfurtransferase [Desulfobaculum xiamenense]|uniref:Rhodanese-related sulfurtransferase n=1 Tax=Desulfobaculum xiamenense TaxID=995050 RepID=A0A846QIV4_9BACT|nr:rhodanese-like domain-containing protein [Desulfobaculum xiamenense]NJB67010.1 rhodanese-related sulfurtransferase [Desulfobaculum xiamenense]